MSKIEERKFPVHGWIGVLLVILSWYLNWNLTGLRTQILFFPLWLGYSLSVDGLVYFRNGNSPISRDWKKYILLFLFSAPAWWLFELINLRTQNWYYDGKQFFSNLEYALYATLSFSTVMPSVFGTAELMSSFRMTDNFTKKSFFKVSNFVLYIMFISGLVMMILLIVSPGYFYVFTWMSVYFMIEPVNYYFKKPSLLKYISEGNWKPVFCLASGCMICGIFWEMWNFYSYPKWIYNVPLVDFLHIFEMPVVGYLGYIPFSFELFALFQIMYHTILPRQKEVINLDFSNKNFAS